MSRPQKRSREVANKPAPGDRSRVEAEEWPEVCDFEAHGLEGSIADEVKRLWELGREADKHIDRDVKTLTGSVPLVGAQKFISNRKLDVLFALFKHLRDGIPATYKKLDPIPREIKVKKIEFWEVNEQGFSTNFSLSLVKAITQFLPILVDDRSPMPGLDYYRELVGEKMLPSPMMECSSAWECVDKNFNAFCIIENAPENDPVKEDNCDRTVDMSFYSEFAVKEGHERYGGKATIKSDKTVMIDGLTAGEDGFEAAKYKFESTFTLHIIYGQHAVVTHLAVSQTMYMKVLQSLEVQNLAAANAAFNRFMEILTTRVNVVSQNEMLLIGGGKSLIFRAASFTKEELHRCGKKIYDQYRKLKPEEVVDKLAVCDGGKRGFPTWTAANKSAWQLCKKLTDDMVGEGKLSGETKDRLSLLLFISTFYHTYIGDFQADNVIKGHFPIACTGKAPEVTKVSATLNTTIQATTLTRTLSVEDIIGYVDLEGKVDAWRDFFAEMSKIQTGIAELDMSKCFPAVNF